MFRNAFTAAFLAELIFGAWVMHLTAASMRPYQTYLIHVYGPTIVLYALALLLTLTLALMLLFRAVFLKGAGRKLQHATKEMRLGEQASTPQQLFELMQEKQ